MAPAPSYNCAQELKSSFSAHSRSLSAYLAINVEYIVFFRFVLRRPRLPVFDAISRNKFGAESYEEKCCLRYRRRGAGGTGLLHSRRLHRSQLLFTARPETNEGRRRRKTKKRRHERTKLAFRAARDVRRAAETKATKLLLCYGYDISRVSELCSAPVKYLASECDLCVRILRLYCLHVVDVSYDFNF